VQILVKKTGSYELFSQFVNTGQKDLALITMFRPDLLSQFDVDTVNSLDEAFFHGKVTVSKDDEGNAILYWE
jgi:hypothetical protein